MNEAMQAAEDRLSKAVQVFRATHETAVAVNRDVRAALQEHHEVHQKQTQEDTRFLERSTAEACEALCDVTPIDEDTLVDPRKTSTDVRRLRLLGIDQELAAQ